jgi:hypothetical protein
MEAIRFPEVNAEIGKGQEESFFVLPSNINPNIKGFPCTFCLKLNDEELAELIMNNGEVWVTQSTNGNSFQPIQLNTVKPPLQMIDLSKYFPKP